MTALVFAVILKVAVGTGSDMSPLALPLATPSPGPDICPQLPSNLPLLSSNCTHTTDCANFQCNLNLDLASVQLKLQLRPCGNESFRQPPYIFASYQIVMADGTVKANSNYLSLDNNVTFPLLILPPYFNSPTWDVFNPINNNLYFTLGLGGTQQTTTLHISLSLCQCDLSNDQPDPPVCDADLQALPGFPDFPPFDLSFPIVLSDVAIDTSVICKLAN